MAKRKQPNNKRSDPLPGEDEMARLYRAAAKDLPPAELDSQILAEARRAVARSKAHSPFGGRWAIPFSTAAVIVLSVGVVLLFSQQGIFNRFEEITPLHHEATPKSPELNDRAVQPESSATLPAKTAPVTVKPAMPESINEMAASQATRAVAPEAKKAERKVAAPVMAPAPRSLAAEERDNNTRDTALIQGSLAKEAIGMGPTADVITVQATGQPGAYQFSVGIRSPDKGCTQYADWWEVVSKDGQLLYRRVLLHSHVDEQPFTRSGGPVPIQPDTVVWVRAHMNTVGYGGIAYMGSLNTGFIQAKPDAGFASGLAKQAPLPDGCAF